MPKKRSKRTNRKTRTYPLVLQQDPNATPEQVAKALLKPIRDRKTTEPRHINTKTDIRSYDSGMLATKPIDGGTNHPTRRQSRN